MCSSHFSHHEENWHALGVLLVEAHKIGLAKRDDRNHSRHRVAGCWDYTYIRRSNTLHERAEQNRTLPTMSDKDEDRKPAATEDEEGSDVEIEGLDLDDDKEADDDDEMANAEAVPGSPAKEAPVDDERQHQLEEEEAQEMEAARTERLELLQAAAAAEDKEEGSTKAADKLDYLLGQSEVFAHFMAGSVATEDKRQKKGGAGGKSHRGRMSEAEEDAQLLKSAASKRRGVVRLEKQPSLLAEHCKMHKYQIEGLNFLLQLHDHGIHGILADEMGLVSANVRLYRTCFGHRTIDRRQLTRLQNL